MIQNNLGLKGGGENFTVFWLRVVKEAAEVWEKYFGSTVPSGRSLMTHLGRE